MEVSGSIFGGGDMARAHYRVRAESWKQVELTSDNDDFHRAIIPGQDVLPPTLEYDCADFDHFGARSELVGSAFLPRRIWVLGEAPLEALTEREDAGPPERAGRRQGGCRRRRRGGRLADACRRPGAAVPEAPR